MKRRERSGIITLKGGVNMEIRLSENLRTLRAKSGRTLENVAEIIDVSRQSVSKWETGISLR